jgi:hypothetical protein
MSHRTSGRCTVWTRMNVSHHAALVYAANCIILCSDCLHMVENLKSAYGTSWKSRKSSWKKTGQDIGSIGLKWDDGSECRNILAERAKMRQSFIIYRTDDVNTRGLETEMLQFFWIHMLLPWTGILAVKNNSMNVKEIIACPMTDSMAKRWAWMECQQL